MMPAQSAKQPPVLVTAAHIETMTDTSAEAFVCVGEWIAAVGTLSDLIESYPGAELIDVGARVITPGFNDAHAHPTICAEQSLQVNLSPDAVPSRQAVEDAIRASAKERPAGEWIVGFGYDPARSPAGELHREALDGMAPDNPVLVIYETLHAGVMNSGALRLAGLAAAADAPPGGIAEVDDRGELNGVVHDQTLYDAAFPAFTRRRTVVPPPSPSSLREAFLRFVPQLHAVGITSVTDALLSPVWYDILREIDAAGELPVRVNGLGAYDHLDYFAELGQGAEPTSRLRLGGIKAFADGAVNGGHCLVETPVLGSSDHGQPRVPAKELQTIVARIHDAGWRACVHANGDRAVRYVLDAVEEAQSANPRHNARHRIEHTSVLSATLVKRMAELGVVAVPFAQYPLAHGDKLRSYYRPETIEWMFAHRALIEAGVPTAGSSDYPCGPLAPLFGMQSLTARLDRYGQPFGLSQRIAPLPALRAYTVGSAYAAAEEAWKGRLAAGYLADFVVLDADPREPSGRDLSTIRVEQTWVGGRRVWPAPA